MSKLKSEHLVYLSDDMYIFERPNTSTEIELIGLVSINELIS